jgi:hypothetical protein
MPTVEANNSRGGRPSVTQNEVICSLAPAIERQNVLDEDYGNPRYLGTRLYSMTTVITLSICLSTFAELARTITLPKAPRV